MQQKNDVLVVQTLGPFVVKKGDLNLTQKYRLSKKPWILLRMLLANKNRVTNVETLADIISDEQYYSNPGQLIHNIAYRLRQMLGENPSDKQTPSSILYENGGYRWNPCDYNELDIDAFDRYEKEGHTNRFVDAQTALSIYEKILDLYQQDFLPEYEHEEWTQTTRMDYRNRYLKAMHQMIELLSVDGRYDDIIRVCDQVLKIDYFDVNIHVRCLQALVEKDYMRQALSHYEQATDRLYKQAGIVPSADMTAIYKSIKQGKRSMRFSLSEVQRELEKKRTEKGALLCDADVFRYFYQLEKNRTERYEHSTYLSLISLVYRDALIQDETVLKKEMNILSDVIVCGLRSSDVVTRWSTSQFLVLLFGLESKHMKQVFDRLVQAYGAVRSNSQMRIIHSISRI